METQETQQVCSRCGGQMAQVDALASAGPLMVAKSRSALTLGIMRASALAARTCTACGYTELYATNPEVLK